MSKHLNASDKSDIVEYYLDTPKTISAVAEHFKLSSPTVIKVLDEFKVKRWSRAKQYSPELDERYFAKINSHEKAYYLGLLTTDGCVFWVNDKRAVVTITLKSEDRYILKGWMEAIKCNRKIVHNEDDTYTATVTSTAMVKDLEKYNVYPNSSTTQEFSHDIPTKYLPDYYRGLLDGDGSYGYYPRPKRNVHRKIIRMCSGSKKFMREFIETLSEEIDITESSIQYTERDHTYVCGWTTNDDMWALIKFIYSTDGPYMIRKKKIADKIIKEIRQYRDK